LNALAFETCSVKVARRIDKVFAEIDAAWRKRDKRARALTKSSRSRCAYGAVRTMRPVAHAP
jgi:hypothetical protein